MYYDILAHKVNNIENITLSILIASFFNNLITCIELSEGGTVTLLTKRTVRVDTITVVCVFDSACICFTPAQLCQVPTCS